MASSGEFKCNLNHILRYKDHPDFRAIIFRFYSDGSKITHMMIEQEWQTSLYFSAFQIDKLPLMDHFDRGSTAQIKFNDYIVQSFLESFPISDFSMKLIS